MDTDELDASNTNQSLNSARHDVRDVESLQKIYDEAFALFNEINKTQEATNSHKVQSDVRRATSLFEDATKLVSLADIFSTNESVDEVATESLKYFLLPALLGTLTTKICSVSDRSHLIDVAEIYFVDFLRRVKTYGIIDLELPENKPSEETVAVRRPMSNAELITSMVSSRNAKLQRYKEQKELEAQLQMMQENMGNPNVDEEFKREYYITLIKSYVNQALDELSSIAAERPLLEHMMRMSQDEPIGIQKKPKAPPMRLQPIIITRDEMQKRVYGAGYPSLPVMTVDEFYEKRIRDGDWPDPSKRNQMGGKCLQDLASADDGNDDRVPEEDIEAEEKEERTENDDPQLLGQARAMDDYKDTHRRGWGNRANRS